MSALSLIAGLLRVVGFALDYARQRQLITAGEDKAMRAAQVEMYNRVQIVKKARDKLLDSGERERLQRAYTRDD